jgi:hypothetical protein
MTAEDASSLSLARLRLNGLDIRFLGREYRNLADEQVREAAHSSVYPSARAFSRTRTSLVTTTTKGGGSPSSSVVARCSASRVRMGSTGNGLRTRARIVSVTATRKQRRSNRRSARTAARSWSAVNRPAACARRIARAASAMVNAEVTLRPRVRTDFNAAASRSRSAATRALDSM